MKIVFMGSSTFAIPSLRILKEAQYDVIAVYSNLHEKQVGVRLIRRYR